MPSMVSVGEPAPDFEAPASTGTTFRLSRLRGRPVVLYFFPRAFTPGCTIETERFSERYPELKARGIELVGVSVDTVARQHEFADKCHAAFPLVADPTKKVARLYDVLGLLGVARRVTFFIDERGIVQDVVEAIRPGPHISRALESWIRHGSPAST